MRILSMSSFSYMFGLRLSRVFSVPYDKCLFSISSHSLLLFVIGFFLCLLFSSKLISLANEGISPLFLLLLMWFHQKNRPYTFLSSVHAHTARSHTFLLFLFSLPTHTSTAPHLHRAENFQFRSAPLSIGD